MFTLTFLEPPAFPGPSALLRAAGELLGLSRWPDHSSLALLVHSGSVVNVNAVADENSPPFLVSAVLYFLPSSASESFSLCRLATDRAMRKLGAASFLLEALRRRAGPQGIFCRPSALSCNYILWGFLLSRGWRFSPLERLEPPEALDERAKLRNFVENIQNARENKKIENIPLLSNEPPADQEEAKDSFSPPFLPENSPVQRLEAVRQLFSEAFDIFSSARRPIPNGIRVFSPVGMIALSPVDWGKVFDFPAFLVPLAAQQENFLYLFKCKVLAALPNSDELLVHWDGWPRRFDSIVHRQFAYPIETGK